MKNKLGVFLTGSMLLGSLFLAGTAFAQTPPQNGNWSGHTGAKPGVFGSVTAINGSTLTIDSKGFGKSATETTYSVDASNATVTKAGSASTLGSVSVGDMVMVQGTVNGTSVTATAVRDGMMPGMQGHMGHGTSTPMGGFPQGNGQPVVGGSVTAINGSTLTITNKSNVTYSIDATSATVTKAGATSTLSSVAVGDNVLVQGAVNGNAVTASSIIDQGSSAKTNTSGSTHGMGGFLGAIGGFFHHLFGFF